MTFGDLPLDAPLKPNKGDEGGACNVQSCQAEPALWWNHGSHSWYCEGCAVQIGQDFVNLRDWNYRHYPQCRHPMFETREMMDQREGKSVAHQKAEEAARRERTEPVRDDFPSRQTFRAAHRKWSAKYGGRDDA